MGKSIRSKIKRKHRAEFRRTIGHEAYQANMEKLQAKLKECIERQTSRTESIERLSSALDTGPSDNNNNNDAAMEDNDGEAGIDASETMSGRAPIVKNLGDGDVVSPSAAAARSLRGENKAPPGRKSRRRKKHALRSKMEREEGREGERAAAAAAGMKPRPRYFCQF